MKLWIFIPSVIQGTASTFVDLPKNQISILNNIAKGTEWGLWKYIGGQSDCCEISNQRVICKDDCNNTTNILLIIPPNIINYDRNSENFNPKVANNLWTYIKQFQNLTEIKIWLHTGQSSHITVLEQNLKNKSQNIQVEVFRYSTVGCPLEVEEIADTMKKLLNHNCQGVFK